MNIFDLQFWVICMLFSAILFIGAQWLKKVLINAVSNSVAQVVADQWALMFKKLDSYKETVENHDKTISELKEKARLNREDIEKIIKKIQNLK